LKSFSIKAISLKKNVTLKLTLLRKDKFMKHILFFSILFISISCFSQRNPFKNLSEKDGKIGIGTSTPDETLTVKGKIHTQEVIVDLQGAVAPDYVFEKYFNNFSESFPEYEMMNLKDLAFYIEKNHHLPEVPSAAVMETVGINLKEMNLLLLKKIEELTLYTLQQQKQLEMLEEKVSELLTKE